MRPTQPVGVIVRRHVASILRFSGSTVQQFFFFAPVFSARARNFLRRRRIRRAAFPASSSSPARTENSPLARSPLVATNTNFVRLEPALLAVSAERIKESLWRELEIKGQWRGQIYLVLHPARSLDRRCHRFSRAFRRRLELPGPIARRSRANPFCPRADRRAAAELADRGAQSVPARFPRGSPMACPSSYSPPVRRKSFCRRRTNCKRPAGHAAGKDPARRGSARRCAARFENPRADVRAIELAERRAAVRRRRRCIAPARSCSSARFWD